MDLPTLLVPIEPGILAVDRIVYGWQFPLVHGEMDGKVGKIRKTGHFLCGKQAMTMPGTLHKGGA